MIVIYELRLTGAPSGAVDAQLLSPNKGGRGVITISSSGFILKTGTGARYPITLSLTEGLNGYYYTLLKVDGTSAVWQYDDFDSGDIIYLKNSTII